MTVEIKPAFIPADLHWWLKWLSLENETTLQIEHEKALREAYELRRSLGIDNTPAKVRPMQIDGDPTVRS
jgi:hypothetical protein